MRSLLVWELKQRKMYIFWWCVIAVSLISLLLLLYPSIHDQAAQLNKVLNQLPETLRDLKTGGSQVDIATPIGYLNSQVYFATLPLILIIMSIGLGGSLLAKDEQNKTLELIIARPISRRKILLAKGLAGLIIVDTVTFVSIIATVLIAKIVNIDISALHLIITTVLCALFSLSFGIMAFTLSATSATRKLSTSIPTLLAIGSYLFATLGNLSHYIATPAKFLPYHYYQPSLILAGNYSKGIIIYIIGVLFFGVAISIIGFNKRDIS